MSKEICAQKETADSTLRVIIFNCDGVLFASEAALYIGDSDLDYRASRAAGIPFIGFWLPIG